MRILLIITIIILTGCDTSVNYSEHTKTSYIDGTKMTVQISVANKSTRFKCVESQSGTCFFKVSSQRFQQKTTTSICTSIPLDDFQLRLGKAKEFTGINIQEKFLHCASAFKFSQENECTLS